MGAVSAEICTGIKTMMAKREILSYRIESSESATTGDGYLGNITFIKVIAKTERGKEKHYNLVAKSGKKSEEFRKQTPIREALEREIYIYTKVFPIFLEQQAECAMEDPFNKFPKCYSTCDVNMREVIILKNLKSAGFEIHDRKVPQNLNHVLYVFQNYAKFHANSLALRKKRPTLFKSLTENMNDILKGFMIQGKMIETFKEDFDLAIAALNEAGKNEIAKKYDGFRDHIEEYLTNFGEPNNTQSVVLHGDCWNNNILFKYKGNDKDQPIDMCFIDFQLSTIASPVLDLSYYLYTCADKSVLDNFDFILRAYYSTLSDTLKELRCDPEDILTFKELQDHWKKFGKFGLCMNPVMMKISLCESDEVADYEKSAENGGVRGVFSFQLKNKDIYTKRVVDVFTHFAEKFL